MNLRIKPLYLSAAFALALAGCGSAKMVSAPVENIDKMPLKTTPLAEKDLKRWSHLDLAKDTEFISDLITSMPSMVESVCFIT